MLQKRLESLEKLAEAKPSLADACRFHSRIFQLIANAEKFVHLTIDNTVAAQRREQGFPLLSGTTLQFDAKAAKDFFADLLQTLHKYGQQKQKELQIMSTALQADDLDLECLLRATLDRDQTPIRQTAEKINVRPTLLEYCLSTALGAALQQCRTEGLKADNSSWHHGYCPICGGLPSIAELHGKEGEKILHCGLCRNSWAFRRLTCVHCGNSDQKTLAYFTAEGEVGYRVDICHGCDGYIKVVDSRERGEELILEVEDIATLHLDLLAAKEGFICGKKNPVQSQSEEV